MSTEEKSIKPASVVKLLEEKEASTQSSKSLSENNSKDSGRKQKSKIKTAEKIPSSRRSLDEKNFKKSKSIRAELKAKGTKEKGAKERSKEVDEMPPTANSAKSPAPNQQKKKQQQPAKPVTGSKTNQTASVTPGQSSDFPDSKETNEEGKIPALTPTPDVPPEKKSKAMGVIDVEEEAKKKIEVPKKEKKILKRETNHIFHLRPGVNKNVELMRRRHFEEELIKFETGEFTYTTDPTRYRFRSTPPLELVIQFVFPSLLLLTIMLATVSCIIFLTKEYKLELGFKEMSEITLTKYDSYLIVDSIFDYLQNDTMLKNMDCPGLVQGFYEPLLDHEFGFLRFENKTVKKAVKAWTYRWITQVEVVMNMNFECPPSVLLEMEK